jgi:hypothetical protein
MMISADIVAYNGKCSSLLELSSAVRLGDMGRWQQLAEGILQRSLMRDVFAADRQFVGPTVALWANLDIMSGSAAGRGIPKPKTGGGSG